MDANYLKVNVYDALTEAISAMVVDVPDDKIEYIGKYLLTFVDRKQLLKSKEKHRNQIEKELNNEIQSQTIQSSKQSIVKAEEEAQASRLPKFLDSLKSLSVSKQSAMDRTVSFISEFFNIPGVYIAIKKVQKGETDIETLNYYSSCPGQEFVVGKQLVNQSIDADSDPVLRSGVSFEAFKVPVIEEEERDEDEEESLTSKSKPTPKPEPLVIDNVMRDQRCKFFGIPKLGYYVAIPFSYQSIEHESGYVVKGNDDENLNEESNSVVDNNNDNNTNEANEEQELNEEKPVAKDATPAVVYVSNKVTQEFIIGVDTIGKYRVIKSNEIESVKLIGGRMIEVFEHLESKLLEKQQDFYSKYPNISKQVSDLLTTLVTEEANALSALIPAEPIVNENESNEPNEESEPIEPPVELESHKPFLESQAIVNVWNKVFTNDTVVEAIGLLDDHALPLTTHVLNLLHVIGLLLGFNNKDLLDVCSNVSWSVFKQKLIPTLATRISDYNILSEGALPKENTIKHIKSLIEKNNLLDISAVPNNLPVFQLLAKWLEKASVGRENAITYIKESKNRDIEKQIN